jgi:hypothetical protein
METLTVALKHTRDFIVRANTILDGQMHEAVAAIAATGVSPIVRIAANEAWMVKRISSPICSVRRY